MTFATDAFAGTSGTELSAYSGVWSKQTGYSTDAIIGTNGAYANVPNNALYGVYQNSATPPSADYEVSADIEKRSGAVNPEMGVCARMQSGAGTFYAAMYLHGSGQFRLYKFVATTATQIGSSYSQTLSTGTPVNIKLRVQGTSIKLLVNDVERVSATDSDITSAGKAGLIGYRMRETGVADAGAIDNWGAAALADTTAPTLTSPSGAGGALTCTGSVSTNEANGTLYAVVTASSTAPSAAQVKAGQDHTSAAALRVVSQSVSATGTQTIGSGSATAGTRYWHFMHEDAAANQSAVVSSASFTVSSAGPTINTQPSNQTATAPATATFTVAATTSGGSLTYQWQREPAAGGGFSAISGATSASYTTGATSVSGGGHNNGDKYRVVVTDSNGSVTSSAATLTVNAAPASLTSSPLKDNTGTLHLSAPFEAFVLNATTGALVVRKQSLVSNSTTGIVAFNDAALSAGVQYRVVWRRTDTGAQGVELLTAA